MSSDAISRLESGLERNDETLNVELAIELAKSADSVAMGEIAGCLRATDPRIASDAIKVMYEVGYRKPELIAPYADEFLDLLASKHNRLVWGGMTALSCIATLAADAIQPRLNEIVVAMANGSVITVDHGVKVLAGLAASSAERRAEITPLLLSHVATCRSKEVPQHAESTLVAVDASNCAAFQAVLEQRMPELTPPQARRVRKVVKQAGSSEN